MIDSTLPSLAQVSDVELLADVRRLAARERIATAQLIGALAELDARKLYLGEGCSSMFTYCTQVLRLSEHAAYGRIEAARAGRRFPIVLDLLQDGALTLTAVTLLAPHLTAENHRDLLQRARHQSKRDVERLVAAERRQPPVPATVRKLPTPPPAQANFDGPARAMENAPPPMLDAEPVAAPPRPREALAPLAPARYKLQLTIGEQTHDKLRRVQDLLRHSIPTGDLAAIFNRALTLLLAEVERRKLASTDQPRQRQPLNTRSRHVPASVKRVVWSRDGGRCAFVGSGGRCTETGFLEFHHVDPYATGGETTTANLQLRCRAHNQYEADEFFGFGLPVVREGPSLYAVA